MSIRHIFIVGAGTMGSGIAQVAATSGYQVTCVDPQIAALQKAQAVIMRAATKLLEKKKITPGQKNAADQIRYQTHYQTIAEADLVIEAASENQTVKLAIFQELDQLTRPEVILASNTSSISITKIAGATRRPEKVIGMHFMNPAPAMPLLEVVRGLQTSDETFQTIQELGKAMGKTIMEAKDTPGFISNRILCSMINESIFTLQEGVGSAEAIDSVMKLGMNHPMGPLALADLIGLDVVLSIMETLHQDFGEDKYRPAPLLRQLVNAGWLGQKSGRGFYRYPLQSI